jgi:hypothetical protein
VFADRPKVKTYFRPGHRPPQLRPLLRDREVSTKAWGGPAPWCKKSNTLRRTEWYALRSVFSGSFKLESAGLARDSVQISSSGAK